MGGHYACVGAGPENLIQNANQYPQPEVVPSLFVSQGGE